jgi:gliding motility-associated lipoprotein GldD
LDYPIAKYADFENECPFTFEMNSEAVIKEKRIVGLRLRIQNESDYLTYKPVNNINVLLRDAQKLTYEHVIKADDILEQPYLNPLKKYTVCSIRWMGMQLLIRNSMQLIVRSISLPVPFIFMQSPI